MRITIAHAKTQAQAIQAADQAVEEVFRGLAMGPVTIVKHQKTWNGSVMTFSLIAKIGFLQNPISGTVEVTDKEVTIDADRRAKQAAPSREISRDRGVAGARTAHLKLCKDSYAFSPRIDNSAT